MHVGKSYSVIATIAWTRRRGYVLLLLSLLPLLAYDTLGLRWVALPWPVAGLLGTAAAFIVGFKNAQTYNRTMEAQHVWNAIQTLSRLVVPERETPLAAELGRFLAPDERARLNAVHAKATWLLGEQSRAVRALFNAEDLVVLHHLEMQKTLKDLLDQQARVERLKDFPYPRQYAVINKIFVWAFAAVLPFCLLSAFDQLGLVWLTLPFSTMLAWLYVALDQVVENTENPFEGGANDVPITHISRAIEADLRQTLGEANSASPRVAGTYVL